MPKYPRKSIENDFVDADASTDRMFYSDDHIIFCDETLLGHSPYFSLLFEVVTGPIRIDREFDMFEAVVKFVQRPSLQQRLELFQEFSGDNERLLSEFDFYAIADAEDIRGLLGIPALVIVMENITAEVKSHPLGDIDTSGFETVFKETLTRTDLKPGQIHLTLQLLISQGRMYINNMYQQEPSS